MQRRKLGNTSIEVSPVAFGCWQFSGDIWGEQDERDSIQAVHAALDAGINFFDTAEGYGNGESEKLLGKALAGKREQAVIATKVSPDHLRASEVIESCENSLRRLGTDYIDLYQIHWPSREVPFAETASALNKLYEAGKIRAIGVSNFGIQDLSDMLKLMPIATNQIIYSLLWRAAEFEVQSKCEEHNVGILCYSPLAQGLLTGKYKTIDEFPESRMRTKHFSSDRPNTHHHEKGWEKETFDTIAQIDELCREIGKPMNEVALAWALQQTAVTAVLVGARNADQAVSNARAAQLQLDADTLKRLDELTDPLKQAMGSDLDFVRYRTR